jgi:ATP-dependent Lhr-like helicase
MRGMAVDATYHLEHVDHLRGTDAALAALAQPARDWFLERHAVPTPAQRLAWPLLAAGKHVLVSAPTGGGKTLAAFLPLLGRLLNSPVAGIRCLYVAPLKALTHDIHKNLRVCLRGIRRFQSMNHGRLRVGVRTGDTSADARRQLLIDPPDILLTTPESLAVLLSQPAVMPLLAELNTVVIDEVHALAGNKRGADLSLSLERLAEWVSSRLQRIGLSATCAPLTEAAQFLVGSARPCSIVQVAESAPLHLTVEPLAEDGVFLSQLIDRLEPELAVNRTTLIFTNTRALAERLSWGLRRRYRAWDRAIAVHHSALAARRRRIVERRLKRGRLRAVVTSTSLELGIDVGPVDGVVLVHPPGSVVRLLQRVGRGGHAPGRIRRGLVLTATAGELFAAAVTAASGRSAQCEPLQVPAQPLDVLCQQLLGMAAVRAWSADEAFALVRRAYPYRDLSRADFNDCLDYLAGRGRNGADWLPARLRRDGDAWCIRDDRTARVLRCNIGTILAEETQKVVLSEKVSGTFIGRSAKISTGPRLWPKKVPDTFSDILGEVDDAYAERLQPGDRFLLDGRCLEFRKREAGALVVDEVAGRPAVPRWAGDGWPISPELARRLYLLRVQAAEALREGRDELAEQLRRDLGLTEPAIAVLVRHFERQECVSEIPDAATLLIETVRRDHGTEYYVHTPLNRAGNDALARLAVMRLAREHGCSALSLVTDLGFMLMVQGTGDVTPEHWRKLLSAADFDADLDAALAGSPTLRERFRRVALTGLMLLRNPLGRQRRVGGSDWAERRLFDKVSSADPNFVLLRQAQREVRDDCCAADHARAFLEQMPLRTMRCRQLIDISPFVESWGRVDPGPAESVESSDEALRRLHAALTGAGESHARSRRLAAHV